MAPLELPDWQLEADDVRRTRAIIDAWSGSDALGAVVGSFGGSLAAREPGERLEYLVDFSARHFDFRAGRERNLAPAALIDGGVRHAIAAAAPTLGLSSCREPRRPGYDHVVMTGGMVRACVVKPRFVAALIARGMRVGEVVFLGGFRAFAGDEPSLAATLGVDADADNEFDAMIQGVHAAFGRRSGIPGGSHHGASDNAASADVAWISATGQRVRVVAAPSSVPSHRRADTRDTYRHWAEKCREARTSALLVTTPVYVPYQAALAVEELGLGAGMIIETIGIDETAMDLGAHSQIFGAQECLQELRAAIVGMRSLRDRLGG